MAPLTVYIVVLEEYGNAGRNANTTLSQQVDGMIKHGDSAVNGCKHYRLFSTSACHLCELAVSLLNQAGVDFEVVDISDSDELFLRYGVRIPVLCTATGRELDWPFDGQQLLAFVADEPL